MGRHANSWSVMWCAEAMEWAGVTVVRESRETTAFAITISGSLGKQTLLPSCCRTTESASLSPCCARDSEGKTRSPALDGYALVSRRPCKSQVWFWGVCTSAIAGERKVTWAHARHCHLHGRTDFDSSQSHGDPGRHGYWLAKLIHSISYPELLPTLIENRPLVK